MADIYATNDGIVLKNIPATSGGSWDAARDATTGQVQDASSASTTTGYGRIRIFEYSGVERWIIQRVFMEFDTSGITALPTSATLKIYGYNTDNSDLIVVKGTQSDSLVAADYDNLDFSTAYSAELATWNTGAYNNFTLNSTALAAIRDDDNFKIAIINYDYDYLDVDAGSNARHETGGYFSEADSQYRPYIDVTEEAPDPVTFNELKVKNSNLNIKNSNLKINIK